MPTLGAKGSSARLDTDLRKTARKRLSFASGLSLFRDIWTPQDQPRRRGLGMTPGGEGGRRGTRRRFPSVTRDSLNETVSDLNRPKSFSEKRLSHKKRVGKSFQQVVPELNEMNEMLSGRVPRVGPGRPYLPCTLASAPTRGQLRGVQNPYMCGLVGLWPPRKSQT